MNIAFRIFIKITFLEYEKLVQQRQLLDGQLNENKNVLDELNLLNDSNQVSFLLILNNKTKRIMMFKTLTNINDK